ncbi:N-acetylmuramoyl-L-alanine amidase [Marinitenerispora sediminis]|uniref:N-acetylmuramoyl-L-alanine amidase n=2 Tax=Marinitenerispora sediminis TaxID=1931232 RepID=A0A368T425_9ACTN|nr:N-acetylmuramoyl-L-alanine amidase [Marinitenerispora sediminis]RCV57214.1 N-acetylmuramoyl-L-alanine amidase [Marinitenerispora sediminis]RCV57303.1 N-acetylmuramoyl-L-alanine amidase [Marinitenerispora sediminis]
MAAAALLAAGCAGTGGVPTTDVTATLPLPAPDAPGDEAHSPQADEAPPAGPLAGLTVVIDPGHNGGNADAPEEINRQVPAGPGTKSCDTVGAETAEGYPEHEFTWDLSQRVRDRLEAEGARVVLTRQDDTGVGPCVNERAEIGNDAGADAAISLHADGAPAGYRGFHVIAPGEVAGYTEDIVEPSMRLAEDVRDRFAELSGQPPAGYAGEDGIDVRTDLGGLNMSTVPKVFLEVGNMGDPTDAGHLADEAWRDRAAAGVAAGVADYLRRE